MRIVFCEGDNPIVKSAIAACPEIEPVYEKDLNSACLALNNNRADAMVAGIDYSTREVILAARNNIGYPDRCFSSSFLMMREDKKMIISDAAVTKHPNAEQLCAIVMQTYKTAKKLLDEEPRIAILSYSTHGSGGKDTTTSIINSVVSFMNSQNPEMVIDGELQLDAAVIPEVAKKKAPNSPLMGRANVLICPDLNSGNILYKAMERYGGWTAAGPILQGFNKSISDLSRGSTIEDVILVIKTMEKLG